MGDTVIDCHSLGIYTADYILILLSLLLFLVKLAVSPMARAHHPRVSRVHLPEGVRLLVRGRASEKDAKLAQKLGQLQPFLAVFPQEWIGQLASFGPT